MAKKQLFRSIFYNGDWHSELRCALELARQDVSSMEIRKSIEALETLLARTDECIHTVTRTTQVPRGIDANVVHQYLLEQIQGEQASLTRTSPTVFELTITGRGNLGSVEATAEHVLELGIIEAKSKAWVAVQFSNLKDQTPDIGR